MFASIFLGIVNSLGSAFVFIWVTQFFARRFRSRPTVILISTIVCLLLVGTFILLTHWLLDWPLLQGPSARIAFVCSFFTGAIVSRFFLRSEI